MGEPSRDQIDFKPEFHPNHPRLIKIGTRDTDGTAVWMTFYRGTKKTSRCFDADLQLTSVHKLGVEWLPRLQLDLFDGVCNREKEASRRDYLSDLVEEHLKNSDIVNNGSKMLDLIPALRGRSRKDANKDLSDTDDTLTPSGSTTQQSIRPTSSVTTRSSDPNTTSVLDRLRSNRASKRTLQEANAHDIAEPRSARRQRQQDQQAVQTVLRVSISNNPARAPVNILFVDCGDVYAFFHKVLVEGGIEESPSGNIQELSDVQELSATLACNGRRHLIRRGNASDWSFFHKDLQRAWTLEARLFVDADCEVDILVHINI